MRLLALDQASKTTGYSIWVGNELIKVGKFTLTNQDLGKRLYDFRNTIKELIKEYNITDVVFEDIQLQNNVANNVKTFKALAEIFGICSELFTELNIPYKVISSNTWKAFIKIKSKKRQEQKQEAQQFVSNTFGLKATQDESDAVCIGYCALNRKDCAW